jgi:large subunit GTPase 1
MRLRIFRRLWADFFDARGVQYAFFSALNAAALQEARRNELAAEQLREEQLAAAEAKGTDESHGSPDGDRSGSDEWADEVDDNQEPYDDSDDSSDDDVRFDYTAEDGDAAAKDPRIRVLSVLELEGLFKQAAPNLDSEFQSHRC